MPRTCKAVRGRCPLGIAAMPRSAEETRALYLLIPTWEPLRLYLRHATQQQSIMKTSSKMNRLLVATGDGQQACQHPFRARRRKRETRWASAGPEARVCCTETPIQRAGKRKGTGVEATRRAQAAWTPQLPTDFQGIDAVQVEPAIPKSRDQLRLPSPGRAPDPASAPQPS